MLRGNRRILQQTSQAKAAPERKGHPMQFAGVTSRTALEVVHPHQVEEEPPPPPAP